MPGFAWTPRIEGFTIRSKTSTYTVTANQGPFSIMQALPQKRRGKKPTPLVPEEVDLRSFTYMELDVALRQSEFAITASGAAFKAAVLLWCAAWHERPAGSLPNNDQLLAHFANFGADIEGWLKVKDEVLRDFVLCSDGRLYHPSLSEKAIKAWGAKRNQQNRTAAATAKRKELRDGSTRDGQRHDVRDGHADPARDDGGNVHQRKGDDLSRTEQSRTDQNRTDLKGADTRGNKPNHGEWDDEDDKLSSSRLIELGYPADAWDIFWEWFPNKKGVLKAKPVFFRILEEEKPNWRRLIDAVGRYSEKSDDRPWMNPANWLEQGRWMDEEDPPF